MSVYWHSTSGQLMGRHDALASRQKHTHRRRDLVASPALSSLACLSTKTRREPRNALVWPRQQRYLANAPSCGFVFVETKSLASLTGTPHLRCATGPLGMAAPWAPRPRSAFGLSS